MNESAGRVNVLSKLLDARKYLEIGVFRGDTFFSVETPLKVAVDPNFRFNPEEHAHDGALYLDLTSDAFFATFPGHPQAHLFQEPDGRVTFDIIYIDGLHTFSQSWRDFENSLAFSHDKTIWILDDTVPCDVFSAIPDMQTSLERRRAAGGCGEPWHGDVFKTLFAIHDGHPEFSYCTVFDNYNPQTVLWRAKALESRRPRFKSTREIESLGYMAVLDHADLFFPVNDASLPALLGQSIDPVPHADSRTWEKMLYREFVTVREVSLAQRVTVLEGKLKALRRQARKRPRHGKEPPGIFAATKNPIMLAVARVLRRFGPAPKKTRSK